MSFPNFLDKKKAKSCTQNWLSRHNMVLNDEARETETKISKLLASRMAIKVALNLFI